MTTSNLRFNTRGKRCVMVMADYPVPTYLLSFDPDGIGDLGSGVITVTTEIADARVFPSGDALLECWRTPSSVVPVRWDGEPNRPLTAFRIEIAPAPLLLWPEFTACFVASPGIGSAAELHAA